MRVIASLAVFAALGLVAFEVWKKAMAAQNATSPRLLAVQQQAVAGQIAKPLPFGTAPILVGGPNVVLTTALQAITGLLTARPSYTAPAVGTPPFVSPFDAPTLYTGNVVPSDADLQSFGVQTGPTSINDYLSRGD